MNLKGLFLTALITFSATNIVQANNLEQQEEIQQVTNQPQWQELWNTYCGVIIPAILIGYTTGKIAAGTNYQMMRFNKPLILLTGVIATLFAENTLRNTLVNEFNKNLEAHSIKNKKDQIQHIALTTAVMTILVPHISFLITKMTQPNPRNLIKHLL